ncbi:MAG: LD-carboxypeptidase [Deltaproteobacteria bacterium]|nr:MAG: LD-carboxypeptidase [Deltaproteobacteria bacterium]
MSALIAPGARIAVVAPSHGFDEGKLARGMAWAEARGFDLVPLPHLHEPHRRFASAPGPRLASLVRALQDPAFDAVWVVRGGSGLLQLLDGLPLDELRPRPVIGFSDVTALFCALDRTPGWSLVHGPVLHAIQATDEASLDQLEGLLAGQPTPAWQGVSWRAGRVQAPLVGGNLTVLAATCGTRHQLRGEGRIVLLEEIGELPYRVERCVQQLISAGVFDGAAAIALGEFVGCRPPADATWTLDDGLRELLLPLGVPILTGLPVGHGPTNHSFVWGRDALLDGDTLRFST